MPTKDKEIQQLITNVIGTCRTGRNKNIKLIQKKNPEISGISIRCVYDKSRLSLYKRPRRLIKNKKCNTFTIPLNPMEQLGIDFMSDCLDDKRRIRTLIIIDYHDRKWLGIFVDFSLPSVKAIDVLLERVFELHSKPKSIRTDNEAEFNNKHFTFWLIVIE